MNIGLSNLAWDKEQALYFYKLLNSIGYSYVEGVLTKIAPWDKLSQSNLNQLKIDLNNNNLNCYSLQSLFFDIPVKSLNEKENVLNHFKCLIDYSKILGVKILVFGSPNLRKKDVNYKMSLASLFNYLDLLLDNTNIKVVIEPNCKQYNGDYFYNCSEIVKFIKDNNFKNIRTMIDTHNLLNENLNPIEELEKNINFIEHVHVSENQLKPIENIDFHKDFAKALKKNNYKFNVTYEVKKTDNLEASIEQFSLIYKK